MTFPASVSGVGKKLEFLDLILAATQDGVIDWDVVTGETQYGPRWKHMLGFDDDHYPEFTETAGLWREVVHPEDRPLFEGALRDHLERGWPFVHTARMRHSNGSYRHVLCRGATQRDSEDRPLRMVVALTDIDFQVRTEERERALISAIPDTIFRLDAAGTIVGLKPGLEREGSPFLLLREGRKLDECWAESSLLTLLKRARCAPTPSGDPPPAQILLLPSGSKDSPIFHELRLVPCEDGVCVCIARDVTDQRALEERFRQSQKLESIGQLAAGVAHEINTPMQFIGDNLHFAQSAIADLVQLIDKVKCTLATAPTLDWREQALAEVSIFEEDADADYARTELPLSIKRSLEGVERVSKIVRAMKDFSHPGGDDLASTDVGRLIESTVTVASNEWKYVANAVLELDPDLPKVPCISGELSQVLLNLIVNAAHAIGDVVSGTGEKGQITIRASFDETHAEIRVKDTGTGIPEAARAKVFDPFFTTKAVGKGTGQGLSMAYRCIVERHRGTLSFETESGRGTTFIIRLPLVAEASPRGGGPK